jgi:uncharacterized protein with NAD-binding domain and iron-sulfur cluster
VTSTAAQSVIILGGGLAGLTAAYRLTNLGYRVTLVNRGPQLGGASAIDDQCEIPEPFALLGCHHATETLLQSLHPAPQQPEQAEIQLEFRLPDGSLVHYPRTLFPAPLHTWANLLKFSGIPWKDRWRLASWMERLWEGDAELPADLEHRTADEWLVSIGQSAQTCSSVWNPIARWLTGNDLSILSADAFVRSVKPLFLSTRPDNSISIVQGSFQTCFILPITKVLTQTNATILCNADATQLRYEGDRISGVLLQNGSLLQSDWYVAALPLPQLTSLLPERWMTRYAYFQHLAELQSINSTVLYVQVEQPCATPRLILFSHKPFHSILATASTPDRTSISLVSTDNQIAEARTELDLETKIPDLLRSLNLLLSGSRVLSTHQRTIPNALLSLKPGSKLHRPIQRSPIENLLLAGSWTDTGWPPNLESAIVSGNRCAEAITSHKPA